MHNLIVIQTDDAFLSVIPHRDGEDQEPGGRASAGTTMKTALMEIDHGSARIGVALSDELQMLAHPTETILVRES